jgi:hypothetical protein
MKILKTWFKTELEFTPEELNQMLNLSIEWRSGQHFHNAVKRILTIIDEL